MKDTAVINLFKKLYPDTAVTTLQLTQGGSDRVYYRLYDDAGHKVIGAESDNIAENECFFYLSEKMNQLQIHAPEILQIADSRTAYLQTDLGDVSLLDFRLKNGEDASVKNLYKKAMYQLFLFQTSMNVNDEKLLHRHGFNAYWIKHDLNYFIYSFVQQTAVAIPYTLIQQEIAQWSAKLSGIECWHLMYRDFQGRNIMVKDDETYLIDYQGAMRGPVIYDVAALLWQAKAKLSQEWRNELLEYYLELYLAKFPDIEKSKLQNAYEQYVLLRLLQVMGAYGFRGIVQNKPHFKSSIVDGLENIRAYLQYYPNTFIPQNFKQLLIQITDNNYIEKYRKLC